MFKPVTHVIYDMDGLLLNTESINDRVNQTIASKYGKNFTIEAKTRIAGRTTLESARILVESLQLPLTPFAYIKEREQIITPLYQTGEPLPGTLKLTQHLHRYQIPQAIASSSSRRNFTLKTTRHQQWLSVFDRVILGDDPELQASKPAPDIFLLAAKRLKTTPENCLVFEDSVAGVTSAKSAGMSVVAIPETILDRQLFQAADLVLNSMAEFQPELWNLPEFS